MRFLRPGNSAIPEIVAALLDVIPAPEISALNMELFAMKYKLLKSPLKAKPFGCTNPRNKVFVVLLGKWKLRIVPAHPSLQKRVSRSPLIIRVSGQGEATSKVPKAAEEPWEVSTS